MAWQCDPKDVFVNLREREEKVTMNCYYQQTAEQI